MSNDTIRVTVTEDGLVKLDTDRISMPNHVAAEGLVKGIALVAGGTTTRRSKHRHGHTSHSHSHHEDETHSH